MNFYGRYGDLIRLYEVSLPWMLNDILTLDQLQRLSYRSDFSLTSWPWYRDWPSPNYEWVSREHLQRVWHASREGLSFRTPGSVPFLDLHMLWMLRPVFLNLPWFAGLFTLIPTLTSAELQEVDTEQYETLIPNYERFPWSVCNGCGMPAGNSNPSGHLVPSFLRTLPLVPSPTGPHPTRGGSDVYSRKIRYHGGSRYDALFWTAVKLLSCERGGLGVLPQRIFTKISTESGNSMHI